MLITIFLIAIVLSLDSFVAASCIGVCGTKKILLTAFKTAVIFAIFQTVMLGLGWFAGIQTSRFFGFVDHWIAFGLLSVIGAKTIIDGLKEEKKEPIDLSSHYILLILGLGTSIDAFATGITLVVLTVSLITSLIIVGSTTFILSFLGVLTGCWSQSFQKGKLEIIGGVILILIGLKILISHLGILSFDNSLLRPVFMTHNNPSSHFVLPTLVKKKITPILGCVRIPILTYHYVEYVTDEKDTIRQSLNINPNVFENQVKSLKDDGYQTYFVSDIPKILAGEIPYASRSAVLTFDDGHWDFVTDILPILKKYNAKATAYIIVNDLNGSDFMTTDQLKELAKEPLVEIGSHTLSHGSLASASAAVATKEIFESKQKLEQLLGIKITTFAYPYGGYNVRDEAILKNAGYTAAVSTKTGVCQSNDKIYDLYRLKAGRLTGQDFLRFLLPS